MINLHPFSVNSTPKQAHLRIMETTDLHVHVAPYDYYSDRPSQNTGLVRTANLIRTARKEAQNTLLVDNGDLLQGTPMGDYIAFERGVSDVDLHPIIHAMNQIGFDATTLGNHEFNYGLDFLSEAFVGAKFPVVCANVVKRKATNPRDDTPLVKPYVILKRSVTDGQGHSHILKIGIIGFTPPQVMTWDRKHLEGNVQARDIVDTAKAYIPQMKEDGADLILALSHSGIGLAKHTDGMENASVPLAALDGIDALVTGHSHLVFPSPSFEGFDAVDAKRGLIHGKPATMAGLWGSHLGVIDLLLEHSGGAWKVLASESEARPIAQREPDGTICALTKGDPQTLSELQVAHEQTLTYIRRPVGKTRINLHSYFAAISDSPSVQIAADSQRAYLKDQLKHTPHAHTPILAAVAPCKTGGRAGPEFYTDVQAGDLALQHIADLYFFPNTIRALKLTGAEIKGWLERSAGTFREIPEGSIDAALLNPDFAPYNFDVIYGLNYDIDISQPARFTPEGTCNVEHASRIKNLSYQGMPVTDEMEFILATTNYRAGGGGHFPGAKPENIIFESTDTHRDILVKYIQGNENLPNAAHPTWKFTSQHKTSAVFQIGPKARSHLHELTHAKVEYVGPGQKGFALFRIDLDT